ncbi:MAG: methyltransferase domain-containing protein [Vicinamibacterales bacterium]
MRTAEACDPWFIANLVCPSDGGPLTLIGGELDCGTGHRFPVVDGVPVMLLDEGAMTMSGTENSLRRARGEGADPRAPELYLESLGISEQEKQGVVALASARPAIDPVVAYLIAATNGLMYRHLIGALDRYPIPDLPLPAGDGRWLLDIGCSWGRWSLAAQAKGYSVVGLDPSLGAVMAARRVARRLGAPNRYVVGDARRLPFASQLFDVAYSYSVLQHLSKADVGLAAHEMGRVLKAGGLAKVQMPTRFGARCLYHQLRRGFREGRGFEVRYWTLGELARLFGASVGATRFDVDCYFGIGLQPADEPLMTPALRRVLRASELLKTASRSFPLMRWIADSVFVEARKAAA